MKLLKKWGLFLVLLIVLLFVQWQKPAQNPVKGLKRFVYEKFEFHYDSCGKMDSSTVETFNVILGCNIAKKEPKNRQLVNWLYGEISIVKRINNLAAQKTVLFENDRCRYGIRQTIDAKNRTTRYANFTLVEHTGICSINGMMCQRIELVGEDCNYMYYLTTQLQANDNSGSDFLIPYRAELLSGFEQLRPKLAGTFIMRADIVNKHKQIMQVYRLKGMYEGVKDTGYFRVPATIPVFSNDSLALQYKRECEEFRPFRGNSWGKRIAGTAGAVE